MFGFVVVEPVFAVPVPDFAVPALAVLSVPVGAVVDALGWFVCRLLASSA